MLREACNCFAKMHAQCRSDMRALEAKAARVEDLERERDIARRALELCESFGQLSQCKAERDALQKQVTAQASAIEDMLAGRALDDAQFAKDKTERDDLRSRCDELEAANGTLQERRDEAMTDRIETERLLHSVTSQALALVTERDALAQRIEKAKAWLSELGHTDDGEMLANQKETQ